MRRHPVGVFWPLILVVSGCSASPIPPADRIEQVRLTIARMPDDKDAELKPRKAELKERADIVEVMDWLGGIDWSQSGTDLAVVSMPPPDGSIILITKSGATHNYSFYWDGGFVHTLNNRLIRGGNMAKWKQLVTRVCK